MFSGLVSVVGFLMVSVIFVYGSRYVFMVSVAGSLVDSAAAGGSKILERMERFLVVFVFLGLVSVFVSLTATNALHVLQHKNTHTHTHTM